MIGGVGGESHEVEESVQEQSGEQSQQRRKDAIAAPMHAMGLARVAQPRAKRRREGRMSQPAEQDAPDDKETEVAVATEREVDVVLHHGEARADEYAVDHAVGDIVE